MSGLIRISEETNYLMEKIIANLVVLSVSERLPPTVKANVKKIEFLMKDIEKLLKDIKSKHGI